MSLLALGRRAPLAFLLALIFAAAARAESDPRDAFFFGTPEPEEESPAVRRADPAAADADERDEAYFGAEEEDPADERDAVFFGAGEEDGPGPSPEHIPLDPSMLEVVDSGARGL